MRDSLLFSTTKKSYLGLALAHHHLVYFAVVAVAVAVAAAAV